VLYQPALRLAEIILRHGAAKPSAGGVEVAAFVVTMWKVFEDFVTVALAEALAQMPGRVDPQLPARLAGPGDYTTGDIPMNVDVVYRDGGGRPRVVFDAKYKVASPTGQYANADHYQMLAYCTALEVPLAWLVYAGGGGLRKVFKVKHTGIEIVQCPLDLSKHPNEVLHQVATIAHLAASPQSVAKWVS
jgi:5-methylcytosine-specific restriction enzyme subunit McrC